MVAAKLQAVVNSVRGLPFRMVTVFMMATYDVSNPSDNTQDLFNHLHVLPMYLSILTLEVYAADLEPVEELLLVVSGVSLAVGGHHEDGYRVPLNLLERDMVTAFMMATYGVSNPTNTMQDFFNRLHVPPCIRALTLEVNAAVLEPVEELLRVVGGVSLAVGGHHEDGHRVPLQLLREVLHVADLLHLGLLRVGNHALIHDACSRSGSRQEIFRKMNTG